MMWFRQMAQVSTTMPQDQRDIAESFVISKHFLRSELTSATLGFANFLVEGLISGGADGKISGISTSAMLSLSLNLRP